MNFIRSGRNSQDFRQLFIGPELAPTPTDSRLSFTGTAPPGTLGSPAGKPICRRGVNARQHDQNYGRQIPQGQPEEILPETNQGHQRRTEEAAGHRRQAKRCQEIGQPCPTGVLSAAKAGRTDCSPNSAGRANAGELDRDRPSGHLREGPLPVRRPRQRAPSPAAPSPSVRRRAPAPGPGLPRSSFAMIWRWRG